MKHVNRFRDLILDHQIVGQKIRINEHYRPIAEALCKKHEELKHVPVNNILFLDDVETEKKSKGKYVLAEIGKIPAKWSEVIEQTTGFYFELVLTVYRENTSHLSREQKIALIYHELRHIRDTAKGLVLVGHDIEDWREMHDKLGPNWSSTHADMPDLLDAEFDWSKFDPPPGLFTGLKAVK